MPAPFIQKANSGTPAGTATTKAVTLSGQAAGNMNLIVVSYGNASGPTLPGTVVSVADNHGNSYLALTGMAAAIGTSGTAMLVSQIFYFPQIPAGSSTITATLSAAASYFIISAHEYGVTGLPSISTGGSIANSPSNNAPTAMNTQMSYALANDLVFAAFINGDAPTSIGAPYTQRDKQYTLVTGDNQPGSAGFVNATGTAGGPGGWTAQIVVFHLAAFPAPSGEVLLNCPFTGSGGTPTTLSAANSWTFWSPGAGNCYAQINAGVPCKLSRVRMGPVAGGEDLPIGATLQGCNDPGFALSPATLLTVSARVLPGTLVNEYLINAATAYQFYRWTMTASSNGAITALDLYATGISGIIARSSDVAISPCTGAYDLPIFITISSLTGGSTTIYYTVDGSTPTTGSPVYSGPFVQSVSCTLQAFSFSVGCNANGRTISRPVHIGNTEVSTDDIFDSRNYRLWALNGNLFHDPVSGYWYRYGVGFDTPTIYTYGNSGNYIYRSADLRNWEFRGISLGPTAGTANTVANTVYDIAMHVVYNAANHNYVAWTDNYTATSISSFTWNGKKAWTSPSPEGPFTLFATYSGTLAGQSPQGDFCLFIDTDGVTAYLVSTCVGNNAMVVAPLNSAYTNFSGAPVSYTYVSIYGAGQFEAPYLFWNGSSYILVQSPQEVFSATLGAMAYCTAASPMGPFTKVAGNPFQPVSGGTPDYTTSYDSQVWQILYVPGRNGYIYHGDRYDVVSNSFLNAKRIRLPVSFPTSSTMSISWKAAWSFDSAMPNVSGAPLAPSNLVVTGTTANWTNNEGGPTKLYLDMATDNGFTAGVQSLSVPDGATSVSGVSAASFYRVRAINANGSSASNVYSTGGGGGGSGSGPSGTIPATSTIDSIFTALWATRGADLVGTPVYTWSSNSPPTLAATWPASTTETGRATMMMARFEKRPVTPSIIDV